MRRTIALLGILAAACGCPTEACVESAPSPALCFCAEVASTELERREGLRLVAPLEPREALLIDFPVEGEVCIENRGVPYAIDALFAGASGDVRAIERDIPADDRALRCHMAVRWVLETRAGALEAFGVGDRLRPPRLP